VYLYVLGVCHFGVSAEQNSSGEKVGFCSGLTLHVCSRRMHRIGIMHVEWHEMNVITFTKPNWTDFDQCSSESGGVTVA
jgi:hypothetical protein